MQSDETANPFTRDEPADDLPATLLSLADDFAATATHAANWKANYFGPTTSARLSQAVADMELATARLRAELR